jgi:hypothetical protein
MIFIPVVMSSIAALTGIFAVGSGRHWQFRIADYFRGKRNAILYLWVTISTIFSILHAGALLQFGLPARGHATWLVLHTSMGALLIAAHLFVASTLAKEVGPVDKFLWGKNRQNAAG